MFNGYSDRKLNRRAILQKTGIGATSMAGAGTTLSTLLGTVSAEETTSNDLKRIENARGVREILSALGVQSLPDPNHVEKRRIRDDGQLTEGELTLWKVEIQQYGILHAFEYDDRIETVFTFNPDLSRAPSGYSMVEETNASLGASRLGLVFSRNATETETEAVLSAIEVDGKIDSTRVHALTAVNGFRALSR